MPPPRLPNVHTCTTLAQPTPPEFTCRQARSRGNEAFAADEKQHWTTHARSVQSAANHNQYGMK